MKRFENPSESRINLTIIRRRIKNPICDNEIINFSRVYKTFKKYPSRIFQDIYSVQNHVNLEINKNVEI